MASDLDLSCVRSVKAFTGVDREGRTLVTADVLSQRFVAWKLKLRTVILLARKPVLDAEMLADPEVGDECPKVEQNQALFLVLTGSLESPAILHAAAFMSENDGWGLWLSLHEIYQATSDTRVGEIQQSLLDLDLTKTLNFADFRVTIESAQRELKRLGSPLSDTLLVRQLMQNLPASYDHLVLQIELSENPTVKSVLRVLEKGFTLVHNAKKPDDATGSAYAVRGAGRGRVNAVSGRGMSRGTWEKKKGEGGGVLCWVCGDPAHIARDCPDRFDKKKARANVCSKASRGHGFFAF